MARDENLVGVGALIAKLDKMGALDDGLILKKAVRDAMEPVLIQARATVPVGSVPHRLYHRKGESLGELVSPGYAQKHITLIAGVSKDKSVGIATVGPTPNAYYVEQFLERGHFTRKGTGNGKRDRKRNKGREKSGADWVPARPWLRPAFFQNQNRIKELLGATIADFVIKIGTAP